MKGPGSGVRGKQWQGRTLEVSATGAHLHELPRESRGNSCPERLRWDQRLCVPVPEERI